MEVDMQGVSGDSFAESWIERRGWEVQVDVAPLPKRDGESLEMRRQTTSDAMKLLNVELAAAV